MAVVVQLAAVLVDEEVTEDADAEVCVGVDVDEERRMVDVIKVDSDVGAEEEGVDVIGVTVIRFCAVPEAEVIAAFLLRKCQYEASRGKE